MTGAYADQLDESPNKPPSAGKSPSSSSSEANNTTTTTKPDKTTGAGNSMGGAIPTFDIAAPSGKKIRLQCTAPDGADVTVTVAGKSYSLKQQAKLGNGRGRYGGNFTIPSVDGVTDLGEVTYTMTANGKTGSLTSDGKLFAVGDGATLAVKVDNASATAFKDPRVRGSGFVTTVKKGAIDNVTSYYGDMYRLASVGWVDANAVTPLTEKISTTNNVSNVTFSNTEKGEIYTLQGTSHPPYTATQTSDSLSITFARTSGVGNIGTGSSSLFSSIQVSSSDNQTTIKFNFKSPNILSGYLVSYDGGNTSILCKPKGKLSNSDSPLSGLVIGVDPGHGGSDTGAEGYGSGGRGPVEKEINRATADALKTKLESLGATVVLLREGDTKVTLSQRNEKAEQANVDLYLSLHCNSSSNTSAKGVEVFYFEPIAKSLATSIASNISAATSRPNRGAKYSCYVVTLNSFAPSVLIELGFMTNIDEYNDLKSSDGITKSVDAIAQSVVQSFS